VSGPVAIWAALQSTALEPFRPASAYGAPALGGALIVCAVYYARRRQARGRLVSIRGFVRSIFPRRILLHPSSLVDMRLWALNGVAFASAYGVLGLGLFFWRDAVAAALTDGFGPRPPALWPAWTVLTLATVLQVLAYELAYWFAHYCFHKVPALWEFHKVHHSAEVMTAFTLLNGNILTMAFLVTYGHLRHSHMWIAFTGVAGRILQSPAHHQLHHSANPAHFDKNLGFALTVWDWAFGTLVIPARTREAIVFGLGGEASPFRSALAALATPCARFAGHALRGAQTIAGRLAKAAVSLAMTMTVRPARRRSN
jgi:sterol desaturase/sphingolipid hydroxylase (fatty acid hydroxylase superfamily)